tara:strand:+ start:302 stop:571 length:270 start_codon:yes stop_codon:yes gene_type:complete
MRGIITAGILLYASGAYAQAAAPSETTCITLDAGAEFMAYHEAAAVRSSIGGYGYKWVWWENKDGQWWLTFSDNSQMCLASRSTNEGNA